MNRNRNTLDPWMILIDADQEAEGQRKLSVFFNFFCNLTMGIYILKDIEKSLERNYAKEFTLFLL